jgi:hypothetical protein
MSAPAPEPFSALLGSAFDGLAEPVRRLHAGGPRRFAGRASVDRGTNALGRLMGWIAGLPPAAVDAPIVVDLAPDGVFEYWTRRFGAHAMTSRLHAGSDGLLHERLGPVTFRFRLVADGEAIAWRVAGARALGVPLPASWFAGVAAREGRDGVRYTFDVLAAVPFVGRIVHYRGWLDVA